MSDRRFQPGDRIGSFTVLCPCGAGAFGQVYLVRGDDGGTRAIKVLSADRRSERELNGLLRFRRVEHPNLLRIDWLSTLPDGTIFYTMDAADNAATSPDYAPDTLARRMRERAPLPPEELRRIMTELASGLAELHRSHLLHRDIKPENILFVNGRATLADAGAVGEAGGETLVGTPDYLSPEVCLQKRAFKATDDCYALGKVLYSALTGEAPRKFPSTPHTLDPAAAALFEAAVRACTPPGVSAYRFRELVEHPEPPRRKRRTLVFTTAAVAVCLVIAGVAAALTLTPAKRTPETPRTTAAPHSAANSAVRRGEKTPPPSGGIVIREIRPDRQFVSEMKNKDDELLARIKRVQSPKAMPVEEKRREPEKPAPARIDRYAGRPKEERQLDNSIRLRLAGVNMNLQTAERDRRNFLARGMDIPEQQARADALRAERDELEAMLKMPLEEKRRAFAEYKKRSVKR